MPSLDLERKTFENFWQVAPVLEVDISEFQIALNWPDIGINFDFNLFRTLLLRANILNRNGPFRFLNSRLEFLVIPSCVRNPFDVHTLEQGRRQNGRAGLATAHDYHGKCQAKINAFKNLFLHVEVLVAVISQVRGQLVEVDRILLFLDVKVFLGEAADQREAFVRLVGRDTVIFADLPVKRGKVG